MKGNRTLVVVLVVLAVVIVAASVLYPQLSAKQAAEQPAQQEASPATQTQQLAVDDFSLADAQGSTVQFSDIAPGKPKFVNFWATWCPYCVDEMDDIQDLYETYGDAVEFVIIDSVDGTRETREMGEAYIAEHGYTFPVYYDEAREAVASFGISAYPTSALIGADGSLVQAITGRFDLQGVDAALAELAS